MEGGELILSTSDPAAARFVYGFKPGDYDIAPQRKKRSLDASAYAWVLLNELSRVLRIPVDEIYRNAVARMGGVSELVCVQTEAVEDLRRLWCKGHLGRQVETEPSKLPGCTNMRLIYGSSDYDTVQMSQFIDNVVQDCHALGIETMPPDRLKALIGEWDEANEKARE
jgi:hypothetical protein